MSPALKEILTLDAERDHQRIVLLSMRQDFPFDSTRALELALFRTYGSPSVSGLLDRSGEFARDAQQRYDDTDILVSELMERGYDTERGRASLRRMNQLHGRFDIPNDDFLYVLSTFVFEPMRWNERFGWRPLCQKERQAYYVFWREVGRRMGIRDIPPTLDEFERFSRDYEQKHFRFAQSNSNIANYTLEMLARWFPSPLRPMVRQTMYAMIDETMRTAFGFPRPWPGMRLLVHFAMRLRAAALRCLPKRMSPVLRTEMKQRTYPTGYTIEKLGPPEFLTTDKHR
jgi:hypothetical protein